MWISRKEYNALVQRIDRLQWRWDSLTMLPVTKEFTDMHGNVIHSQVSYQEGISLVDAVKALAEKVGVEFKVKPGNCEATLELSRVPATPDR